MNSSNRVKKKGNQQRSKKLRLKLHSPRASFESADLAIVRWILLS